MTAPVQAALPVMRWWRGDAPHPTPQAGPEEENPWMSHEEFAPAWAVSALTLLALATLVGLALLG